MRTVRRGIHMATRNYRVSEYTKKHLLKAAGELFASRGTGAVTVRDITGRAGTKPNAISYHFGGKDGLIEAVWQYVLRRWNQNRLEQYCAENDRLFATRKGRRQIVTDTIDIIYEMLFAEGQEPWVNMFLLRTAISAQGLEHVETVIGRQVINVLCRIFRRITGNDDRDTALCWALNILAPGAILTASSTDISSFAPTRKIDYSFYCRLQSIVTRNAILAAGI